MSQQRYRAQRGFTLIEVVVAFAIFALSAAVLYEEFGSAGLRATKARDRSAALLVAQSLLSQTRGSRPPWNTDSQGDWGIGGRWHVHVQPYKSQGASTVGWAPYEVTVTVEWTRPSNASVILRSIELGRMAP